MSAKQGYTVKSLQTGKDALLDYGLKGNVHFPISLEATGGCGLGGNTAIIPEVQDILDYLHGRVR